MSTDRYTEGFLAGQAVAYCERVRTGMSMAAQLVCPNFYIDTLTKLIASEGCKVYIEPHEYQRTSLWVYRHEVTKDLILALQSGKASPLRVFAMGKLFGYGDREVTEFIALPLLIDYIESLEAALGGIGIVMRFLVLMVLMGTTWGTPITTQPIPISGSGVYHANDLQIGFWNLSASGSNGSDWVSFNCSDGMVPLFGMVDSYFCGGSGSASATVDGITSPWFMLEMGHASGLLTLYGRGEDGFRITMAYADLRGVTTTAGTFDASDKHWGDRSGTITVTSPVPEPSSALLVFLGGFLLVHLIRRKHARNLQAP